MSLTPFLYKFYELNMKEIRILLLICFCLKAFISNAQNGPITTAVPFLMVSADAKATGMGDVGAATETDAFSQQYNPAKYAFALQKQSVSVSYTPYLTSIVNDVSLGQVTYYNTLNERSAFASSLRYFGLGEIELRESFDSPGIVMQPNELALDLSYSLKLSTVFSMAVAGRFIRSNLRIPDLNGDARAATGMAFDIAGYFVSEEKVYKNYNGRWSAGFNFQNMGPKINYEHDSNPNNGSFLPANMKLGGGFDFIFDQDNRLGVYLDLNKLLVPTPPRVDNIYNEDGTINQTLTQQAQAEAKIRYQSIGWASGIFRSFGDAPGGFREELQEISYGIGAEYIYQDAFAIRTGYYNESEQKGARRYVTLGFGFKYESIKVDLSYLFSTSRIQNPLENILRFSITFGFGDFYTN